MIVVSFLMMISILFLSKLDSVVSDLMMELPTFYLVNASAILLIFSLFLYDDGKKKKKKNGKSSVTKLTFGNMTFDVSLFIPEVYDSLKEVEGIVDERIFFYKEDDWYLVEIDAEIKKGLNINDVKTNVENRLGKLLKEEYEVKKEIPISFNFKEVSMTDEEEESEMEPKKESSTEVGLEEEKTTEEGFVKKEQEKEGNVKEDEEVIDKVEVDASDETTSLKKRKRKKTKRMSFFDAIDNDKELFQSEEENTLKKIKDMKKEIEDK